jgi:transposase
VAAPSRLSGLCTRAERSHPLVDDLEIWLREQRGKLSPKADLAKAIGHMLSRWRSFTRFLQDGRVCLTNNATFAGSDAGGRRAATMYTLIET